MHDDFETVIDGAVKSYAAAEPSPELATIILRRAQQEPMPLRLSPRLALALALPFAAVIAIMATVLAGPLDLPPAPNAVATAPAAPKMETQPASVEAAPKPMPAHAPGARAQAARSTVLPLPMQYTKQELAMLSFVQRYPKEAAAIAKAQQQDMQPLSHHPIAIARLRIAPLTISVLNPEK